MQNVLRSWLATVSLVSLAQLSGCGGGGANEAPSTPLNVVRPLVIDSARATSARIGPEGGTLRTTAAGGVEYTLTVPPRALTETVTIRMTPIIDIGNPALAAGLTGAVQFEPSGLRFQRLATLRIGTAGALPTGSRRVGFSSTSDGSRIQLSPPIVSGGGSEIPVAHFSSAGVVILTPEEIARVPLGPLADLSDPAFWYDEIARGGFDLNPAALAAVFTRWLDEYVNLEIARASTNFESTSAADLAFETWFVGLGRLVIGVSDADGAAVRALLASPQARTQAALARAYLAFIDSQLTPCPIGILPVGEASYFQGQAARFGIGTVGFGLDRPSFLRKVNDCLRPVLDPVTLPSPLSAGVPTSLDLRAQVVFNGLPDPKGEPFEFTISATDAALARPVGDSDGAGRYTTVFTPSTTAPTFNVRACLFLLSVPLVASDICVTQQLGVPLVAGDYVGTNLDLCGCPPGATPQPAGMRVSQSGSLVTIDLFRIVDGVQVGSAKRFVGTISAEGSVRIGPPLDPIFYGTFSNGGFSGFLDDDGAARQDLEQLELRRQ